jgi:predicted enzyme related to lactoylglutathione lyase
MPVRDTAWDAGTPCWIDYSAADLAGAQGFYTALLGWDYDEASAEFGGYQMCRSKGRLVAGIMPRMDPAEPPMWTTYLATDDADATAAAVTAAGGTVLAPPMSVAEAGRMAVFMDPQGHVFGVWQAGTTTGVEIFNEPGALVWNELAAPDPAAARDFYASAFGYHYDTVDDAGDYRTFATGEQPLGGIGGVTPGVPAGWSLCFAVASTDEAVTIAEGQGAKVLMGAEDTPFGRFAVLEDPWGASFSVMQDTSG